MFLIYLIITFSILLFLYPYWLKMLSYGIPLNNFTSVPVNLNSLSSYK